MRRRTDREKVRRFVEIQTDGPPEKRQDANDADDGFIQYCKICGVPIPIMFFPWIDGETEELVSSTCNGMRTKGATDQILLYWNGVKSESEKKRSQSGCKGYCKCKFHELRASFSAWHFLTVRLLVINKTINARYGGPNECDEFPPTSSDLGGKGAHLQYIAAAQNQLGGRIFSSYAAAFKLRPGSPYIIRVLPSCNGILKREESPMESLELSSNAKVEKQSINLIKRQDGKAQTIQGSSSRYTRDPRPGVPADSGFVIAPLSGAISGHYDLRFSLSSSVQNVSLVDGNGIEYVR
jgi:Deoxyribonuclease NucA/NucB